VAGDPHPVIGICTAVEQARWGAWNMPSYLLPRNYVDAIQRGGGLALMLPPDPRVTEHPDHVLDLLDGLILAGGADVDPSTYGAERHNATDPGSLERDEFELALARRAMERDIPFLGICRGMQVMNVAFGGTLHQHLSDVPDLIQHGVPVEGTLTIHEVSPTPGSRLAAVTKSGPLAAASHHHQGIDRLGDGLAATGRTEDGLIEAIERTVPDQRDPRATWMLGVQWHPEETAEHDPAQQSLFVALSLLARLRGSRAKPGAREGRSRAFEIEPYDPGWPRRFETESARIEGALGDEVVGVEHVGSTAVPGLGAKPVVDIQVSVRSMVPRAAYLEPLVHLGYRWALDPWTDEHEFFSRDEDGQRAFHIHVCGQGSEWERRHLAFRDRLRSHPEDAAAYERLKRDLAERHPRDTYTYADEKTAFIRELEARIAVRA
jgi:putative glutamine amidotransferase